MGKVVEGVYILQQMAFFDISDAGCLAAGIQLVGYAVGALIELVIVLALVDPDTPEHYGWMVAVLHHHLLDLPAGHVLPRTVAYMLPARYLCEDQKTQFVAGVDKGLGLGIVGGPDSIAAEFLF